MNHSQYNGIHMPSRDHPVVPKSRYLGSTHNLIVIFFKRLKLDQVQLRQAPQVYFISTTKYQHQAVPTT